MAKKRRRSRRPRRVTLKPKVADLLRLERVARVATTGSSGMPHVVPVCHVLVGQRLYFGSSDDGRKVLNLKENPKIAMTIDVYTDAWGQLRGVMVQGHARLVERGRQFQRIRARLYAKYAHYGREAALSPSDSTIVEVKPTRVFAWGLD
jgi:nitroimidazol reductase NimA-like FMN-containing flavoprotein (pyridoxamine 5'-phosphate oxidase superfamily)